ncbi:indole-3-glycerol phosphate synthase TrpC [Prevotella sp. PCHR]|uniref:indole-3-glycerol-phosphate synthase n=1 Tax=Xylanibacter caecicola TaxID=2736294 RepID=A0ABX2B3A8_9BACT|nr:indole-3-glycerol phosphate synthase TrpC [Xylanibacter caecicola]NPE24440.1 indole-3-glycerol phosphate synthase TrpC [Xylanibacter caecicola]
MDILEEIVAWKRLEVERFKETVPATVLYNKVESLQDVAVPSMCRALMTSDSGIIAEFKRRSPSKGWIREDGDAAVIPLDYQKNGASAVSILTDAKYFGGNDGFVQIARQSGVTLPVLYKNFVVDEYQLFQARVCGASAVLLIAAALSRYDCAMLMRTAHEIGLEVLLEIHGAEELEYLDAEPDMCGVNNRNLGTFITDVQNSFVLSEKLPRDICRVSESGIGDAATVCRLRKVGFNGFLIGESFMKEPLPGEALHRFITTMT